MSTLFIIVGVSFSFYCYYSLGNFQKSFARGTCKRVTYLFSFNNKRMHWCFFKIRPHTFFVHILYRKTRYSVLNQKANDHVDNKQQLDLLYKLTHFYFHSFHHCERESIFVFTSDITLSAFKCTSHGKYVISLGLAA